MCSNVITRNIFSVELEPSKLFRVKKKVHFQLSNNYFMEHILFLFGFITTYLPNSTAYEFQSLRRTVLVSFLSHRFVSVLLTKYQKCLEKKKHT